MTAVVVSLCGGALLCLFLLARSVLWRRTVSVRPVVAVAKVAAMAPGTAVLVRGRTAASPVRTSPVLGRECVWYELFRYRTQVISSNYEEHTHTVDETWGDLGVYDAQGARVAITAELAARPILGNCGPMVADLPTDRPVTGHNSDFETTRERLVDADSPIVATGVVEPDGTLGKGSWLDGTAQTADDVFARHLRFERWALAIALALLGAAAAVVHVF